MPKRLLDSFILIDHFNGISQASAFVLGLDPANTAISVITYAEILVGFEDGTVEKAKALLSHYELLSIEGLRRLSYLHHTMKATDTNQPFQPIKFDGTHDLKS